MVASKSAVSTQSKVPAKARAATQLTPRVIPLSLKTKNLPNHLKASGKTVPIQLRSRSTPMWLLRLYTLQRPSSIVMFLLMATMLSVYSWTVYSQKMWINSYHKLDILQRDERQLTTTSEVLKNKMALQAEQPITNLVKPNPVLAIFLQPAPQRPDRVASPELPPTKPSTKTEQPTPIPLGY